MYALDDTPETPSHRLNRHAGCLRELTDFNMTAARLAHGQLCTLGGVDDDEDDEEEGKGEGDGDGRDAAAEPPDLSELPDIGKPTNLLVRVSRTVIALVQTENALFAPPRATPGHAAATATPEPPRARADDPRRKPLREALHDAVADPDPARRRKLRAAADTAVEDTLLADPEAQTGIYTHLQRIAAALNITLNPAKLSDEVLGMPPRVYRYEHERNPTPSRTPPTKPPVQST